jgi:hypothetical protein
MRTRKSERYSPRVASMDVEEQVLSKRPFVRGYWNYLLRKKQKQEPPAIPLADTEAWT